MNGLIAITPEIVAALVESEFGLSNVGKGRYYDLARDFLQGGRKPTKTAALQLLERLQGEADEQEARRVASAHIKASETATRWQEFKDRRATPAEEPAGFRVVSVLDEASKATIRTRVPEEWVMQS